MAPNPFVTGGAGPPRPGYVWDGVRWGPKRPKAPKLGPPWSNLGAFTPFQPLTPDQLPGGTYDVGLDAQLRAGERGFGYLQEDVERGRTRLSDDFQRSRAQTEEDFGISSRELARQFGVLANRQNQAHRAAGTARGGALVEALQKRGAAQQRDQSALTLDKDRRLGALALALARETEDLGTRVARGGSELGFLRGDIGAAKLQQAKESGYEFPVPPSGEKRSPGGQVYREVKGNHGTTWYLLPNGHITKRKPA